MEDLAGPGETLISKTVHDAITNFAACSSKGETSVKGLDRAIESWSVDRLEERSASLDRGVFVGRRAEIRQFEALLNEALVRGQGYSILLRGEPGIGKTRLIEEFATLASQNSVHVHKSLALDFGVGKGQAPIPALVRSLLAIPAGSNKKSRGHVADKAISEGLLDEGRRIFLNDLLDLRQPPQLQSIYDAMDNTARNTGQQESVVSLIAARARAFPLLIIVEDIHWADRPTLDHLIKVASGVANLPVLLVMTTRPEGPTGEQVWIASMRGSPMATLELQPLRAAEALVLAEHLLAADTAHLETIVARAEGNPLFLEQLSLGATEASARGLPDTLQGVVLARMDQLPERDREALRAAAVLGQRFSLDALHELAGDSAYKCDIPVRHRLVRPEGADYIFAHALIQDGIYRSLLQARKHELHRRAAHWFAERDLVVYAEHLDRAEDPSAARAYADAAKVEQARFRFERAFELVERGGEIAREAGDRYTLSILHGELLQAVGSFGPSVSAFQRAFTQSVNDEDRCRALIGEALGLLRTDQHDEAEERLQKAEKLASAENLNSDLAQIYRYRATVVFARGDAETSFDLSQKAAQLAQQSGSPELEAQAWSTLADAEYARGHHLKAMEAYQRCIDISRTHGFRRIETINRKMQADILGYMNEIEKALDHYVNVIEGAKEIGDGRAEFLAHIGAVATYIWMGRLAEARQHALRAREIIINMDARRFLMNSDISLAAISAEEGDKERARDQLSDAESVAEALGIAWLKPWLLGVKAKVAKDDQQRLDAIEEAEALFAAGTGNYVRFEFYEAAMDGCIAARDWDTVERLAEGCEAVERLAEGCEAFFGPEPLDGPRFLVERGRALAAFGRGQRDDNTLDTIRRLRVEAESVGRVASLPPLDAALASHHT